DTKAGILARSNISHRGLKNGKDFNGKGEDLVITGLQATGSMEALNIAIDKASIAKLKIELEQKHDNGKSTGNKQTSTPILNGWIKSFSIANIAAGDVAVNMYAPAEKKQVFSFNKNALVISNFKLDTTATMDGSLLKTAEDVVLKNDLITFKSKDNLYTYACKGLTVRLRGKSISLKEFAIQPMLAEQAFANKAVVQKDRYDVQVRNITLTGVDFEKALNGGLSVDKITASNNSLKIYRDISKPLDSISKVGNSPHQLLYKLKLPVAIYKLIATNTLIQFKERNGLSDTSGSISFANSVIQIDNIINHVKPGKSIMNFNMSGKFIGQVPVDVNIRFYLDRFRDGYTEIAVKSAHHFNGTILNKSIEPMGLVRIDRGNIYSLDANLTTDNYYARGKFTMQYDDLKLTLLKRKKQSGNFKKRDILSLIANVVVKNSNPKNGNLRTANVNFRRNDYKSFFNMIWKFAFTAIKDVMGAKL
ncbi:MAG: hypothetical protein LH478_09005, partial [Chitinophagaceae bacterium]|nr:hypothetical protein [Chitinophagaceae bacterium]